MAGHERDLRRDAAVGDRDAGRRRARPTIAETPGTTSNGTPGLGERERLLAAAAEDERVAALEPHDLEPAPPELDEQRVQLRLRRASRGISSASSGASATSSGATSTS